jgi:UDP-N-acetyl-D-mannosaminuronic acid dehydrogenase
VPEADAFIIAVPTPFQENRAADLSYVQSAVTQIAPRLKGGELVVLESTSPPGTTEQVSRWLAELRPDLRLPHEADGMSDIFVAHCPERVLPGRIMIEMITNDRVIGASPGAVPTRQRRSTEFLPRARSSRPMRQVPRWQNWSRMHTAT